MASRVFFKLILYSSLVRITRKLTKTTNKLTKRFVKTKLYLQADDEFADIRFGSCSKALIFR